MQSYENQINFRIFFWFESFRFQVSGFRFEVRKLESGILPQRTQRFYYVRLKKTQRTQSFMITIVFNIIYINFVHFAVIFYPQSFAFFVFLSTIYYKIFALFAVKFLRTLR
jgi:hypothetical protein